MREAEFKTGRDYFKRLEGVKFKNCVYDVVVESDHKPLETIFKKPVHNAPKRLQRMRLRLQSYDIRVEYKKGTMMYVACTLSRTYWKGREQPE